MFSVNYVANLVDQKTIPIDFETIFVELLSLLEPLIFYITDYIMSVEFVKTKGH